MKVITDKELQEYQDLLGSKEYRRQYANLYNEAKQHPDKRNSGKKYKNSLEKLQGIKEKYKNGVTPEILAEFL